MQTVNCFVSWQWTPRSDCPCYQSDQGVHCLLFWTVFILFIYAFLSGSLNSYTPTLNNIFILKFWATLGVYCNLELTNSMDHDQSAPSEAAFTAFNQVYTSIWIFRLSITTPYIIWKFLFRPNKQISVFQVTGLKILGRVGTYIFLSIFLSEKNTILCILKGILPFKMNKIIFFPENLKRNLGFTSKFR